MNTHPVTAIAREAGCSVRQVQRAIKRLRLDTVRGPRNSHLVQLTDLPALRQRLAPSSSTTGTVFYLIRLLPDVMPDSENTRIKVGITNSVEQRLADHRTTSPTLALVDTWACKATWEDAAKDYTTEGMTRVGPEVFDGSLVLAKERAETFFGFMPDP